MKNFSGKICVCKELSRLEDDFSTGKCLSWKMSQWENVSVGKYITGKMSQWENISLGNVSVGKSLIGKMSQFENVSVGKSLVSIANTHCLPHFKGNAD